MRIAMIGHKRIPGREGGIEVVVEELATRMVGKDNEVVVYNRKKRGLKLPKEYKGVKLIEVPTIEKKSTDAVVYSFLASIHALFCKYDVIHYHAIGPSFFLIIPHLFGIKTVVTVHGLNYKTPKWKGFGEKFIKWGEMITARFADEVIVLSKEQQNYFKEKYKRETIFIPNGTSVKEIIEPDLIKKKYGLEKGKYILFVSRIVPGKGIEYLLKAYKEIDSDLRLIIAGESAYVDDFFEMITRISEQDERVFFTGFVEGKELQELYSNSAIFVFPSEAEGMPMCLLEAMSYNCNCLVSDIPENVEVGKGYVTYFESKNVNDLKYKLQIKLEEKDNNISSREYIINKYNWDSVVENTLNCYRKIKCH